MLYHGLELLCYQNQVGFAMLFVHDKAISDIFMPPPTALHFHTSLHQYKWVNASILYVLHKGKLFLNKVD